MLVLLSLICGLTITNEVSVSGTYLGPTRPLPFYLSELGENVGVSVTDIDFDGLHARVYPFKGEAVTQVVAGQTYNLLATSSYWRDWSGQVQGVGTYTVNLTYDFVVNTPTLFSFAYWTDAANWISLTSGAVTLYAEPSPTLSGSFSAELTPAAYLFTYRTTSQFFRNPREGGSTSVLQISTIPELNASLLLGILFLLSAAFFTIRAVLEK